MKKKAKVLAAAAAVAAAAAAVVVADTCFLSYLHITSPIHMKHISIPFPFYILLHNTFVPMELNTKQRNNMAL